MPHHSKHVGGSTTSGPGGSTAAYQDKPLTNTLVINPQEQARRQQEGCRVLTMVTGTLRGRGVPHLPQMVRGTAPICTQHHAPKRYMRAEAHHQHGLPWLAQSCLGCCLSSSWFSCWCPSDAFEWVIVVLSAATLQVTLLQRLQGAACKSVGRCRGTRQSCAHCSNTPASHLA